MKTSHILILIVATISFGSISSAKSKKEEDKSIETSLQFKEGDEDGNELKALKTEMLVMRSEKRALIQLQKLVRKHQGTRLEPEMLFRLAELYMRRARTERFFEVHRYSDKVMSFAPTLVKQASEKNEILKAVDIYEKMQRRFPDFRSADAVVFNNAFAYQQIGEEKKAEKLYGKLVAGFKDSDLVPDSYLAMGEINYGQRKYSTALEHFQQVARFKTARVYPYGLYKAAWCYYNMQDAPHAIKQLEAVIQFGREVAKHNLDAKLDLRKEALNDLTLFFGDVFPSEKAVDYIIAQAGDLDPAPVILRLTELYKRHSRFPDIEVVLKNFLVRLPKDKAVASVYEQLIWNYEQTRARPQAVAQLKDMVRYCRESGPLANECQARITDSSKNLATKWHKLWKKKQPTEELSASAEQAYRIYFESGGKDEEAGKIRYSFAELLFQRKEYRESSAQYALVQGNKPDAQLGEDAAYAAIVSLEKAVESDDKNKKWTDSDEKLFTQLAETYLKYNPKNAYALDVEFKKSFIAYEKGRYAEASVGFKRIGWGTSTGEKVQKAQDLYLDILNIQKDYKNLKTAAQQLLKQNTIQKDRTQAIEKIYREAYFAEIQGLEEKGELKPAVEAYKKFALESKDAELSGKAWWNASQLQFRIGDAEGGANTCHEMHKLFPKSSKGKDCLIQATQTFESLGNLEMAAKVAQSLVAADSENQSKWRELSADFYALSGDRTRAVQTYLKLSEGLPPKSKLALLEKAGKLEKLSQNLAGYNLIQTQILKLGLEPQTSEILVEQLEAALAKGDWTTAFNQSKKIIGKDDLPKNLLARARFVQAQVLADEFEKQSVKTRVDKIAMVLAIKTEKLEKAQKAFQSAIHYGDPVVSVKALRRLSECYLHYASALRGMEIKDKGLAESDYQALKSEMENLVIPMEEKGIESLAQAVETAKKYELRDGTVGDLQSKLDELNMKKTRKPAAVLSGPGIVVPDFSSQITQRETKR